jgi:hypothetical protein
MMNKQLMNNMIMDELEVLQDILDIQWLEILLLEYHQRMIMNHEVLKNKYSDVIFFLY